MEKMRVLTKEKTPTAQKSSIRTELFMVELLYKDGNKAMFTGITEYDILTGVPLFMTFVFQDGTERGINLTDVKEFLIRDYPDKNYDTVSQKSQ